MPRDNESMKTHQTIAGNTYCVSSPNGGTVTDASGSLNKPVEAGDQVHVTAPSGELYCDDDAATIVKANFKRAALALGLLGGGNNGLPAGYTRVEFLENAQNENSEKFSVIELQIDNTAGKDTLRVVSTHCFFRQPQKASIEGIGQVSALFHPIGYSSNTKKIFASYYAAGTREVYYDVPIGDFFTYDVSRELSEFIVKVNNIKVQNVAAIWQNAPTNKKIGCFGRLRAENSSFAPSGLEGRKKDYKLFHNGKLIFSLIPAIDPTGTPCMFDLITRKPFYNSGTGDFWYPGKEEEASTYSLRRPRRYAQMTEHGIRRLYHVPKGCELTLVDYAEANGFKLLIETPKPEKGYWAPVWHDREDCIELEWEEMEPPAEELLTDA